MAIGRERLRQILHQRGISFQRARTWKESADPDKNAKLDRIEHPAPPVPIAAAGTAGITAASAAAAATVTRPRLKRRAGPARR